MPPRKLLQHVKAAYDHECRQLFERGEKGVEEGDRPLYLCERGAFEALLRQGTGGGGGGGGGGRGGTDGGQ